MSFWESAAGALCQFPASVRFSKGTAIKTAADFQKAGVRGVDSGRYLSGAFLLSLFAGALSFFPFLLFLEAGESAGAGVLFFLCTLLFFLRLPSFLAGRRQRMYESELPFLLRELAVYIDIGIPFEKCIARIGNGDYALSEEFAAVGKEVSSGSPVQSALSRLSQRSGSLALKRALLILSTIYETGGKSEPIRRMAEEISAAQLTEMRAQAGRFSLLAIAFIAASALIPSFFTIYAAVMPMLASERIPEWQVWAAFLLAFPALDCAVLAMMSAILPPVKHERGEEGLLGAYAAKKGVKDVGLALSALFFASLALAAAFFAFGMPMLSALCICAAPLAYGLLSYGAQREIADAEARLPDALYSAASTHRLFSSERMLSFLARGDFGRISESFGIALNRQKAGESFENSLEAAEAHCPSPLVRRAFSLLIVSHQTGADMYFAMRESAQDVVSFFALVRERAALLSMQRYTILASSALLVPAILGAVAYLVPPLAEASETAFTGTAAGGGGLGSILLACQAYLIINAALSSLLLALSETDVKRSAIYFAFSAPCALAVFAAVSGGIGLPSL